MFKRTVHVWSDPVPSNPFSLGKLVRTISRMELQNLDPARLSTFFGFLLVCRQPDHWPVLERVARLLLKDKTSISKLACRHTLR